MLSSRWRKVMADLWDNKLRTLLVALTIGVGVFGVGMVSSTFTILLDDMNTLYAAINPHLAQIYPDPFDETLLNKIRQIDGVEHAEGRSSLSGRILSAEGTAETTPKTPEKVPMGIVAIPELDEIAIDQLSIVDSLNDQPLDDQEVYLERSLLSVYPVELGDELVVELSDGRKRSLTVAGIVHDLTFPSYMFAMQGRAYVTPETMEWLGGNLDYDELLLTVSENPQDEEHVRAVALEVAKKIEKSGRTVYFTYVDRPGVHWAASVTEALMALMGAMGVMTVLLSTFLVINTINALLNQQVRQIGMMKAIGGTRSQLIRMYLGLILIFGILALIFAVPLGSITGYLSASLISKMLNFDLRPFRIPPVTLILQLLVGLLVPLGAALVPVLKGTRLSVRKAVSQYGLGNGHFGKSLVDRLVESIRIFSRPLLLSLRNTIRRKGRLILTLTTLVLGGAIFIAVMSVQTAFDVVIEDIMGYFLSDVNVDFAAGYRFDRLEGIAMEVPGVTDVEGWGMAMGQVLSADKDTATEVLVIAPPGETELFRPVITKGRNLLPEDENAMLVGNHLLNLRPELDVGDVVTLELDGKESTWHVVGTYMIVGNVIPPFVYVNYAQLADTLGVVDQVASMRVMTSPHDPAAQEQAAQMLEAAFKREGINVSSVTTGAEFITQQTATTDVVVYTLLVMAVLIAFVGGLGLMGTMSMNVLERTREIGVMRAIGASNRSIFQLVLVEGMLIGVISWLVGAAAAIPINKILLDLVGQSMLSAPMPYVYSMPGLYIWLVVVILISVLASFLPARNAARLTVREVLAYE